MAKNVKTGGRKRGTPNKKTAQWEALGSDIVGKHAERFNKVLDESKDEDFADLFLKVLNYFKPQKNRSSIEHSGRIEQKIIRPKREN